MTHRPRLVPPAELVTQLELDAVKRDGVKLPRLGLRPVREWQYPSGSRSLRRALYPVVREDAFLGTLRLQGEWGG